MTPWEMRSGRSLRNGTPEALWGDSFRLLRHPDRRLVPAGVPNVTREVNQQNMGLAPLRGSVPARSWASDVDDRLRKKPFAQEITMNAMIRGRRIGLLPVLAVVALASSRCDPQCERRELEGRGHARLTELGRISTGVTMPGSPHHRSYAAFVGVAMCLVLVACGGSSGGKEPAGKTGGEATSNATEQQANTKPCDLLTVDELKAATGFPAQPGKADETNQGCKWVIMDGGAGEATVTVDLLDADLYPGLAPSTAVKVTGVGDEALWASGLWTLYVHTTQQDFDVQVVLLNTKQQPIAQALALKVLARL